MGPSPFSDLVAQLLEAMGQQLDAIRQLPEGILLRTGDGFLYAFVEDPNQISLEHVRAWLHEVGSAPVKLAVLTPGHLPLALAEELARQKATLVEGNRFGELVRSLGLGHLLGDEPKATPRSARDSRLLPSARQLDAIMTHGRTWLDWGVPALSLRFFRQAIQTKPEFVPARVGIGRSLLALGLVPDAERTFQEILQNHPTDVEARLGIASVLGATGKTKEEIALYRRLLEEDSRRVDVRSYLVAAYVSLRDWTSARKEIEALLSHAPEDPNLRFLHSLALAQTDSNAEARRELDRARTLGITADRESALAHHLGVDPPTPPPPPASVNAPAGKPRSGRAVPVLPSKGVRRRTTRRGRKAK